MAWLGLLAAFASALAADQLSKRYVLAEPRFAIAAPRSYLSIRCMINRRMAFAALSHMWIIGGWMLCAALTIFLMSRPPLSANSFGAIGIGLVIGGITGNVIDLLRRRGIVDFIALGSWTVFNIADVAIIGGLVLTLLALV